MGRGVRRRRARGRGAPAPSRTFAGGASGALEVLPFFIDNKNMFRQVSFCFSLSYYTTLTCTRHIPSFALSLAGSLCMQLAQLINLRGERERERREKEEKEKKGEKKKEKRRRRREQRKERKKEYSIILTAPLCRSSPTLLGAENLCERSKCVDRIVIPA